MNNSYDVLIVGGGFSGLYAAYRLLQNNGNLKIAIVERLSRIGGRIITEKHGEHVLEWGPMRYEPELQVKFASLLNELNIKTKDFPPYTCPNVQPDFNKLTFEEIEAIHINSNLPPAFALLKFGLQLVLGEQWDVNHDHIHDPSRDERKNWLKKDGLFQGRYLHQHGLWDTLAHVMSKSALDFLISNGSFYHLLGVNPNAADQITFLLDILATANSHLITIDGGSDTIIKILESKILQQVELVMNTTVVSYTDNNNNNNNNDEYVSVLVKPSLCMNGSSPSVNNSVVTNASAHTIATTIEKEEEETKCTELKTKHLIFTCQQQAYQHINGFPTHIKHLFDNSVFLVGLFKIFIVIDRPPFDEHSVPIPNFQVDK